MEIIEKYIFQCPGCGKEYEQKQQAIDCMNSGDEPILNVGDIVELQYEFSWFDGDKRWVINPDVLGSGCSMRFYYVVTHIDRENHRTRYHVMTKAMTGEQGHRGGWIYNAGHHTPKIIDAPDFVKKDSKSLIGQKAQYLF